MSTILLVDDEPEFLDLYSEVLELMDHCVLKAHDGREALDIAHVWRPDLVVTDWQMPRMNGLELCQRLVQDVHLKDVPVLMHSTSRDPHAPGVRAFVSKCAALSEFEQTVNQILLDSAAEPAQRPPGPPQDELSGTARRGAREPEGVYLLQ